MKRFTMMALLAGLAFAGCGKSSDPVGKANSLADQMCACKANDSACADKVEKDLEDFKKSLGKDYKPSDDDAKKLDAARDKYDKCEDKARGLDMGDGAASGQ